MSALATTLSLVLLQAGAPAVPATPAVPPAPAATPATPAAPAAGTPALPTTPNAPAAPAAPGAAAGAPLATVSFVSSAGAPAGKAQMFLRDGKTALDIELTGLTPGEHGFHLHMVGKCEAPGFASAGSHLNPTGKEHGWQNPRGAHIGDLPNLTADANGAVKATITFDSVPEVMFDADGTALVVHAKPDDYTTDPSGNSGDRVVCGVVTKAA